MGKKTVRGHDIANRFVYSLKGDDPTGASPFSDYAVHSQSPPLPG